MTGRKNFGLCGGPASAASRIGEGLAVGTARRHEPPGGAERPRGDTSQTHSPNMPRKRRRSSKGIETRRSKPSIDPTPLEVKATATIAHWVAESPELVSYFTKKRPFTDLEITFDSPDSPSLYAHRVVLARRSTYFSHAIDASDDTGKLNMSHRGFNEVLFALNLIEFRLSDKDMKYVDVSLEDMDLFAALEFVNGYYHIPWLELKLSIIFMDYGSLYEEPLANLISFLRLCLESGIAYRWFFIRENFTKEFKVCMQFWIQLFPVAYEFKHEYVFKACLDALAAYFTDDKIEFQATIEEYKDQIQSWSNFMLSQLAKRQMLLRCKGERFFCDCLNTLRSTPFDLDPWD